METGMNSRGSVFFFLLFLTLLCGLGALYYVKGEWTPPMLTLTPQQSTVGLKTVFTLTAADTDSDLRRLEVVAHQGSNTVSILSKDIAPQTRDIQEQFSLPAQGLKNEPVTLVATVTDTSWHRFGRGNKAEVRQEMALDLKPPVISVLSGQHNVNQGGAGCLVYSTNEELARSGVQVGSYFFPGYPYQGGKYICFFALPYEVDPKAVTPVLVAEDLANNAVTTGFFFRPLLKKFKHDSINISDNFLQSKMGQFVDIYPGLSLVDVFLKVNSELRAKNVAFLKELGTDTVPQMLWEGTFVRLPNSAPMAGFGDNRTYMYQNNPIDNQTHLGADLASLVTSPVPAGNTGRVILAEFMGIYGNVIVLDHGFGVHSLYSHLSEIHVHKGDTVQRSQIIGKTGATGMAGGDHLHFGMLISGIQVQPIEWWDSHWIRDNITAKLN
ncbi:MAG: M23 family metallopeptidase [Desulfovibrionales bacterium]|nr:M23 family metallopeptidase [Desulfovibrionales bacterium]